MSLKGLVEIGPACDSALEFMVRLFHTMCTVRDTCNWQLNAQVRG